MFAPFINVVLQNITKRQYQVLVVVSSLVMSLWYVLEDIIISYSNPLIILMAVFMLMFFKDMHFHNHFINVPASATLGVYAIHEFKYVRYAIWSVFDFGKMNCSQLFKNLISIAG